MSYARTSKFKSNENNHIISINYEHALDTLTITFIGSTEGYLQLQVKMDYDRDGNLEKFNFSWIQAPAILTELQLPADFIPTEVIEVQEWSMMADSASSKVLIRGDGVELELNGEPATNFGQHIFIDTKDSP